MKKVSVGVHPDLCRVQSSAYLGENVLDWLVSFLSSSGQNQDLARGIMEQRGSVYVFGPRIFPLCDMERICGPEEGMRYRLDRVSWEKKISCMMDSVLNGWSPEPIITSFVSSGASIHQMIGNRRVPILDGNNRYETLRRLGIKEHPTITLYNFRF